MSGQQPIIEIQGICKRYQLGGQRGGYLTLREELGRLVRSLGKRSAKAPDFWALRDVSFDIQQGEAVGIIGRNGAGKSTLLKILSRITPPSDGRIVMRGRVASLLEVGTGFHPELTGRENIFLNGAILGMSRAEVRTKFDEIVAFAEVEKFLDTPVKRYSSGMYVRLAFAVAAHLEPEILVVDEVLAVGDAQFQKKCLGKMGEVAKGGRTVLFVSHNMAAINRLCSRAFLLEHGQLVESGEAAIVTSRYLRTDGGSMAQRFWADPTKAPGDATARLRTVRVLQDGAVAETVDIRRPVQIEVDYWLQLPQSKVTCFCAFMDDSGTLLFGNGDGRHEVASTPREAGIYRHRLEVPGNLFAEGLVKVLIELCTVDPSYHYHALEFDAVGFTVVDTGQEGSVRAAWGRVLPGVVRPALPPWECRRVDLESEAN